MEQQKKVAWSDGSCFLLHYMYIMWTPSCVCVCASLNCKIDCTKMFEWKASHQRYCDALGSVLLENKWQRVQDVYLAPKFPRSQADRVSVGCAGQTSPIHSKYLLLTSRTRYHSMPSEVFWSPWLNKSELFWRHKGNVQDIRQVVIMLWIGVYVIQRPM